MCWQVQETITISNTDSLWTVSGLFNVIACTNFSFLQHTKVKSWSVMCYEQGWHPRFIHADANSVARYARLRYFKFSATDAVSIAYAHLAIGKPFNGEVFSELAKDEVMTSEKVLPVVIRVGLINKDSSMFTTVAGKIALRIAIDIKLAHHSPARDRRLPD